MIRLCTVHNAPSTINKQGVQVGKLLVTMAITCILGSGGCAVIGAVAEKTLPDGHSQMATGVGAIVSYVIAAFIGNWITEIR